ncbi:MAG: hypothetical protein ACOYMG_27370 [Candidatus Methylumidiphilus sp.]
MLEINQHELNAIKEREQQAIEREQERQRRQQMDPLALELEKIAQADPDPNKKDHLKWLTALEKGHWKGDTQIAVAERIKQTLCELKTWKEHSSKKDPTKDKEHQVTKRVLKFFPDLR